ncbi:uncharacterized protein [Triticum aestivum]|uniref:uncharacterized protein n=1 Tax=Triticum aestivum TaxID=4565 RepID=UPI001D00D21A|nr:uncharacterized protein LOC123161282 [Triticum aestivum]
MLDDSFDTSRRLARLTAASLVSGPARRPPCVPLHAGRHNFGLRDAPLPAPRPLKSWILYLFRRQRGRQLGRRPNPVVSEASALSPPGEAVRRPAPAFSGIAYHVERWRHRGQHHKARTSSAWADGTALHRFLTTARGVGASARRASGHHLLPACTCTGRRETASSSATAARRDGASGWPTSAAGTGEATNNAIDAMLAAWHWTEVQGSRAW